MTLQDVAEYLQLSRDLIYRLAQKGKMPASKVGGRWRFKKEKIDQWVESHSREKKQGQGT
jgi:excisionase family DNA binding protein